MGRALQPPNNKLPHEETEKWSGVRTGLGWITDDQHIEMLPQK